MPKPDRPTPQLSPWDKVFLLLNQIIGLVNKILAIEEDQSQDLAEIKSDIASIKGVLVKLNNAFNDLSDDVRGIKVTEGLILDQQKQMAADIAKLVGLLTPSAPTVRLGSTGWSLLASSKPQRTVRLNSH